MPRIPIGQEQQRINPGSPVTIGSTGDARLMGEAVAGVGVGMQRFADQAQKVQDAQLQVDLDTKKMQLDQAAQIASEEAIRSGEKDKVAHYNKIFEEKTFDIIGDAEPELADRASTYASRVQVIGETHTGVLVAKENEKKLVETVHMNLNATNDMIRQDPRNAPAHYKTGLGMIDSMAATGVTRPDTIIATRKAFTQESALSLIAGYEQRGDYTGGYRLLSALATDKAPPDLTVSMKPNEALSAGFIDQKKFNELVATGTDYAYQLTDKKGGKLSSEETQMMLSLPSKAKSNLIEKFRNLSMHDQSMKAGDIQARIGGMETAMLNGVEVPPSDIKETLSRIDALGGSSTHKQIFKNKVLLMNETAQATSRMRTMDSSGINKFLKESEAQITATGSGDKWALYGQQAGATKALQTAAFNIQKQRQEDGPLAAITSLPEMQKAYAKTKDGDPASSQTYAAQVLASPINESQKILPKAESLELGKRLKASQDPDMLVGTVNSISQRWGPYADKILGEAIKSDKDLEPLQLMRLVPDVHFQRAVADNYRNGPAIKKNYLATKPSGGLTPLQQAAASQFSDINRVFQEAYPDGSASGFFNTLVDHAVTESLKGAGVTSPRISEAAESLRSRFQVISGGSSTVVAPQRAGGLAVNKAVLQDFLEYYSHSSGLRELNIEGIDTAKSAVTLSAYAAHGRWIPLSDMSGVAYKVRGTVVNRVDGTPIVFKYSDIMKQPLPKNKPVGMGGG